MNALKIIFIMFFTAVISEVFPDHVMVCTYFDNSIARVYNVKQDGTIIHDYNLDVEGNPWSLTFAPNGRWGLVGSHTTYYPPTQKTSVISVNNDKKIKLIGTASNEAYHLTAISPDSKYGVYGSDLKTLRYDGGSSFTVIPVDHPILCGHHGAFSSLNGYFYTKDRLSVDEYRIAEDETLEPTGFEIDISPTSPNQDFMVTPDGKTLLAIAIGDYQINSLKVKEEGGCELVQQFNTESNNAEEVVITPDSKYAIVAFSVSYIDTPALRCYKINDDSTLSETGTAYLLHSPGEDLAISPDGKYVVTRALVNNFSYFYVVRVNSDGTLTYLPDKDFTDTGHVSAMAFVPEPQPTGWVMH